MDAYHKAFDAVEAYEEIMQLPLAQATLQTLHSSCAPADEDIEWVRVANAAAVKVLINKLSTRPPNGLHIHIDKSSVKDAAGLRAFTVALRTLLKGDLGSKFKALRFTGALPERTVMHVLLTAAAMHLPIRLIDFSSALFLTDIIAAHLCRFDLHELRVNLFRHAYVGGKEMKFTKHLHGGLHTLCLWYDHPPHMITFCGHAATNSRLSDSLVPVDVSVIAMHCSSVHTLRLVDLPCDSHHKLPALLDKTKQMWPAHRGAPTKITRRAVMIDGGLDQRELMNTCSFSITHRRVTGYAYARLLRPKRHL